MTTKQVEEGREGSEGRRVEDAGAWLCAHCRELLPDNLGMHLEKLGRHLKEK